MRMLHPKLFAFSFLSAFSFPASPQVIVEPIYSPNYIIRMHDMQFNPVVNRVIEQGRRSQVSQVPSTKYPIRSGKATMLAYVASPKRTKANVAAYIDHTRNYDPAAAQQLERIFRTTNVIAEVAAAMRPLGMSPNNLGDAYTVYWISAWDAVHGLTGGNGAMKRLGAIKAQLHAALLETPELGSIGDTEKQEIAETLLIQAALIDSNMDQAVGDPAKLNAIAKAVRDSTKGAGLDFDNLTLTEQGFKPIGRKGSDAGDAIEAADPTAPGEALAANDVQSSGGSGSGLAKLAVIAAAGGAGLGGVFLLGKRSGRKG